jgi:hypothetical protein
MFEISSDRRMSRILPVLRKSMAHLFGKQPGQIFAPVDQNGDLKLGYILARTVGPISIRRLITIRGISEMAAHYDSEGALTGAVSVPATEVEPLIAAHSPHYSPQTARIGDYVRVLSGEAKGYCGTLKRGGIVWVNFPSGRRFVVTVAPGSVQRITTSHTNDNFWGVVGA